MQTIKIDSKNTKMIAHRGLSGIELENTASAFVAAGNRSYFGIETDIHATTDNKFVVIHDETTERVSDENINVEEVTYENLSINLQAIAKNALEELNDLKNEDASKETSAEPQPKDEAANAVLPDIVESLQEHLDQQDDQPKEEEE